MEKKTNILQIALSLIFIVLFNVILFLTTKEHSIAFWISYGFIHFSYFMLLISIATVPKVKGSAVFGFPLIYISWFYFLVTFFVGLIFMFFKYVSVNLALIPQLIIASFFAFSYITHLLANDHSIKSEKESREQIFYAKSIASELKLLLPSVHDPLVRKRIENLYDTMNSSQIKSYPALAEIENHILSKVEDLKRSIQEQDNTEIEKLRNIILGLIAQRNSKIQMISH